MQQELLPNNYWCCAMISYWRSFILKWDPWEGFRVTKKNTKACPRFAKKTSWWFPNFWENNLWTEEINLFRTFESHCILDDTYKAFHKKSIIQVKYGVGSDGLWLPQELDSVRHQFISWSSSRAMIGTRPASPPLNVSKKIHIWINNPDINRNDMLWHDLK